MKESKYDFEACQECYRLCLTMVNHCQTKGGPQTGIKQIRLLLDCAEISQTVTDFRPHGSDLHLTICNACAVVSLKCAAACEEFIGDELMQACAAACRRCAEFCQTLVASASERKVVYKYEVSVAARNTMAR